MKSLISIALGLSLCITTLSLRAEETAENTWSGQFGLGYLHTSGNTDSETLKADTKVGYRHGRWTQEIAASAYQGNEAGMTTAERYEAAFKSKYAFSEHNYLYGAVKWQKDRFSGYDQQTSETVGYGRQLLDSEYQKLSAELGAGGRQSKLKDGSREDEAIARAYFDYDLLFGSDHRQHFEYSLLVESGSENTYVEAIKSLRLPIGSGVGLKVSWTVRHNTDVPAGTRNTDQITAINLDYVYK